MQPSQWFGEQVIFLDKQQFKIYSDAKKNKKPNSQRLCKKKYGKLQRNKALCFSHLFSHVRNHCHLWTQATQPWLHLHRRRRLKLQLLARFNHWWTCVTNCLWKPQKRNFSWGEVIIASDWKQETVKVNVVKPQLLSVWFFIFLFFFYY